MNIYEHRATVSTAAGAANSSSLNVRGGLLRQLVVRANTAATTLFRVTLTDANSMVFRNYAYHEGELNDMNVAVPVSGIITIGISSSSAAETYTIKMGVQE